MNKFIVTTTINQPTGVIQKHAEKGDWTVIVSGDLKTPHEQYEGIDNLIYLSPEDQEKKWKKLSDLIGWKCIQRRNFSILEAYERGADVIAIIDDDNIPKDNWGKNLSISSNDKVEVLNYELDIPVFDPLGAVGCDEFKDKLWHRGFPLELLPDRKYDNFKTDLVKPSIQADLWDGEPDVDAICRMMYKPVVESWNCDGYVYSNKLSPFNSQNTFMTRDVIRDYFLFPHIGRMDDIWASYYVQSVGHKAVYGKASVYSDRALGNAGRYSVIEDMKREYLGYENNLNLVEDLEKDSGLIQKYLPEKSWDAFCEYKKCIKIIGD
jgi:hypothetical protein